MAPYIKEFVRRNHDVPRLAAHRAGEKIKNDRTSEEHDYSARTDVAHKEIILPSQYDLRMDMAWARDRSKLWNAAQHATKYRSNSRVAREYEVALPTELSPEQKLELTRSFSQELANRYQNAVDFSIREPLPADTREGGRDNPRARAHLLMTTREVGPGGMGRKTAIELNEFQRRARGLNGDAQAERVEIRERWVEHVNSAFEKANVDKRIVYPSLKARKFPHRQKLEIRKSHPVEAQPHSTQSDAAAYADENRRLSLKVWNQHRELSPEQPSAPLRDNRYLGR